MEVPNSIEVLICSCFKLNDNPALFNLEIYDAMVLQKWFMKESVDGQHTSHEKGHEGKNAEYNAVRKIKF